MAPTTIGLDRAELKVKLALRLVILVLLERVVFVEQMIQV